MSNGDFRGSSDRATIRLLTILTLSVICVVTALAGLLALYSAYKLGKGHPDVALYCGNDPDLLPEIRAIKRPGNEAAGAPGFTTI